MKKCLLIVLLMIWPVKTSAQDILRPPLSAECAECPPLGSMWCNLYPQACEDCWDACAAAPPRRVAPNGPSYQPGVDYRLPKDIGAIQIAFEEIEQNPLLRHMTPAELADDFADHGIYTIKVWLKSDPFAEGMDEFWTHPMIKTYFVRFTSPAWAANEATCSSQSSIVWEDEPIEEIVAELYRRYGQYDKTIVITNWEGDWQWRGAGCTTKDKNIWYGWYSDPGPDGCVAECNTGINIGQNEQEPCPDACSRLLSIDRLQYLAKTLERRQSAVQLARSNNPGAKLRVFHAAVVNFTKETDGNFNLTIAKDVIPYLKNKPDFIGLSWWDRDRPIIDGLQYIKDNTGYPPYRIYVDEIGASVDRDQYTRIVTETKNAWDWRSRVVFVWMWKQTWCGDNLGVWEQVQPCAGRVEWGEPGPGYHAIMELKYGGN